MTAKIQILDTLKETVNLLGKRPLHSLGIIALFSAISTGLPYLFPEAIALGAGIGLIIASCYIYLMVTAFLIADSNFTSMGENGLLKNSQGKFIWYFLFLIIFGLAASVLGGIPAGVGMASLFTNPEALAEFETDPEGALLTLLQGGTSTLLFSALIAILLINLITTAWFVVPAMMVGRGQNLGAMGASAKLVGTQFGRIYLLSLISILINAVLLVVPVWLVLSGQMADNLINNTLIGIPQGIGYAFTLAMGVMVWRQLDDKADAASVFS